MAHRDDNPRVLSASTINGDAVVNSNGDKLGQIEELMIDLDNGRVAYAVLSFGGFLGIGDKLFAIPFEALQLDTENHRFVLDVPWQVAPVTTAAGVGLTGAIVALVGVVANVDVLRRKPLSVLRAG